MSAIEDSIRKAAAEGAAEGVRDAQSLLLEAVALLAEKVASGKAPESVSPAPPPSPSPAPEPVAAPAAVTAPEQPEPVAVTVTPFTKVRHWIVNPADNKPVQASARLNGQHFDRWPVSAAWKGGVTGGPPSVPAGLVRNHSQELVASLAGFYRGGINKPDFSALRTYARTFAELDVPLFVSLYGIPSELSMFPDEPSRWPSWPGMHACPNDWDLYHKLLVDVLNVIKGEGAQIVGIAGPNEPDMQGRDTKQEAWSGGYPGFFIGDTLKNDAGGQLKRLQALADMQRALYRAGKEAVPDAVVYSPEFVWYSEERGAYGLLRKFITEQRTSDGQLVREFIEGIAAHHYDWGVDIQSYANKCAAVAATRDAIDPNMPVIMSEVAVFEKKRNSSEAYTLPVTQHARLNQQRLFITAAHGFESVLHWVWDRSETAADGGETFIGSPAKNANVAAAFQRGVDQASDTVILQAAELTDGTIKIQTPKGIFVAG